MVKYSIIVCDETVPAATDVSSSWVPSARPAVVEAPSCLPLALLIGVTEAKGIRRVGSPFPLLLLSLLTSGGGEDSADSVISFREVASTFSGNDILNVDSTRVGGSYDLGKTVSEQIVQARSIKRII